jgi:hypothetical protein
MSTYDNRSARAAWATGGLLFAAALMIMSGLFQFFQGIAAVAKDQIFVAVGNYVYKFDTTSWGWIHLIIGIIVAVVGFFVMTGATWARWVGIVIVGLQALSNFFFLPYYPLWSLVIIGIDVFVIWALAAAPREFD